MAEQAPRVTRRATEFAFDTARVDAFLRTLERMASGQLDERLPISPSHDALDAIAHAINVLVGELSFASARAKDAQEEKEAHLRDAVANAETRSSAILKAIPDLMFVILRDGTYVDYHARNSKLLFVPPTAFIGKKVRDVMPPALVTTFMDAIERAVESDDPVVVEYELPLDEPRYFEARIVQAGADRILSIVRDVTESKRALKLNRHLSRRLIASQELERQRIARELHDDISQRIAMLSTEIDALTAVADSEATRARLRALSARICDIATDVHDLSYALHPSWLKTLGLVSGLQSLCRDASKQRALRVSFTHHSIPSTLDADVSLNVFRIVQEGLHNIIRHSQADEASVSITCDDGHLALQIVDAGAGFDSTQLQSAGLGLDSMRERVAVLKGRLSVDSAPGQGTRITVQIPLASQEPLAKPTVAPV